MPSSPTPTLLATWMRRCWACHVVCWSPAALYAISRFFVLSRNSIKVLTLWLICREQQLHISTGALSPRGWRSATFDPIKNPSRANKKSLSCEYGDQASLHAPSPYCWLNEMFRLVRTRRFYLEGMRNSERNFFLCCTHCLAKPSGATAERGMRTLKARKAHGKKWFCYSNKIRDNK